MKINTIEKQCTLLTYLEQRIAYFTGICLCAMNYVGDDNMKKAITFLISILLLMFILTGFKTKDSVLVQDFNNRIVGKQPDICSLDYIFGIFQYYGIDLRKTETPYKLKLNNSYGNYYYFTNENDVPVIEKIVYLKLGYTTMELIHMPNGPREEGFHFCLESDDFDGDFTPLTNGGVPIAASPHLVKEREAKENGWRWVVLLGLDGEEIEFRG